MPSFGRLTMKAKKLFTAKELEEKSIAFIEYYNRTAVLSFYSTGENQGKSLEDIYERFLINKGKTISELRS